MCVCGTIDHVVREVQLCVCVVQFSPFVSGFGGLWVACCLEVPKSAGSNPAEAVRIFQGEKNLQHAFLRRGSKAVGPMS